MRIEIPKVCVVAMVGVSGSGKSTFAKKYFKETEILSSDYFRGLISDDENNQAVSKAAFEALYFVAEKRLSINRTVVIDATNVKPRDRAQVIDLAKKYDVLPVAIILNTPEDICIERDNNRSNRQVGNGVISRQSNELKRNIKDLRKEGFRYIYSIDDPNEELEIVRVPSWTEKYEEHGPFDIIGDIHGCFDELIELLEKLGYIVDINGFTAFHKEGRKVIFIGDLCDRGNKIVETLKLAMNMVKSNNALSVIGNHDSKLFRYLKGSNVQITHGLGDSISQLENESELFIDELKEFLDSLVSHYVLDNGRLVVAHAGMKEKYQGKSSKRVRDFALYGDTTGESDEYGLPIRLNWAADYRGRAKVIYGHTPTAEVSSLNNTFNIDTGCVFGGKLTAFRYPEGELVSVAAKKMYYEPVRPLKVEEEYTDILNIEDILEKRYIDTELLGGITIREENAAAAVEIMSRYAADPHWLIYLPPTMSPSETSKFDGLLEHPSEAFSYYLKNGVTKVVCEQKHMGSRAVIIVCKDNESARKHFHIEDDSTGIIYTRTGRHFFEESEIEEELVGRIRNALTQSKFWDEFNTSWVCLDTELMPWSAKALGLLEKQYAPTGLAGVNGLAASLGALQDTLDKVIVSREVESSVSGQNIDISSIVEKYEERYDSLKKYVEAYRRYCWDVKTINDYRIAPFHILATEGAVHSDKNHVWHMETINKYISNSDDNILIATNNIVVDLNDEVSINNAIKWWENITALGGEGMVVKPYEYISRSNSNELLQPAIKCRGREYLRIIYGPEYTMESKLVRLKKRSLSKKRSLALREFSLGIESLTRFCNNEPLYRVHECVFGVLALESEPVDPRL